MNDRDLLLAAVTLPATMLTIASLASATSDITSNDLLSIQRSVYVGGGVIILGALLTKQVYPVLAASVAVAVVFAVTHPHLTFAHRKG